MTIRTKIRIGIEAALVVVGIIVVVLTIEILALNRDIQNVQRVDDMELSMFDLELLTSDYLSYGLDRARDQWWRKHATVGEALVSMEAEFPVHSVILVRMRSQHETLGHVFSKLVKWVSDVSTEGANGEIRHEMEMRMVAQIGVNVLAILADASRLRETLYGDMSVRQKQEAVVVACGALSILGVVGVIAFLVHQTLVRPLAQLHEGMEIVGAGNLEHRLGTDVQDEMGDVSRAFDRMAARLRTTMASRDELALEVAERRRAEAELEKVLQNLERSNHELEQFAYVASHDLQEPLRKITAFGDLLEKENGDEITGDGVDYLHRMQKAVGRMQNLINDLLLLSRVTSRARPLVPTDLNEILEEVVSVLEPRISEVGAVVEVGSLPTIDADPGQMRQVFQNLVSNGLKFNKPDVPPVVKVSALPSVVADNAGVCQITVEDKGIGFDDKYGERIFGIFQRLHSREAYVGYGIGLAICRKIAMRHGGTILANGRLGEGAIFTVVLPIHHKENEVTGREVPHDDATHV